jgi:predicted  nucleic acid-binding Zn-ribbon protein
LDFLTIGFLLGIVGVSGFIAYVADNLGRKLGKKRLSVGKMRPKHVAIFGVVLTGMVVSGSTIALVAFASKDVRRWLLYGRQALEQLNVTREKVTSLELEGTKLELSNKNLVSRNYVLTAQASRLKAQIETQRKSISTQTETVTRLRADVRKFEFRVAELDRRETENRKQLEQRQADLTTAKKSLAQVQSEIDRAKTDRYTAVKEFNDVNRKNYQLTSQNSELSADIAKREGEIKDLQTEATRLSGERKLVEGELDKSKSDLERTQRELGRLETQLNSVQADYRLAVSYNQMLGSTFAAARKAPMTFKIGEEVVRLPVAENLTVESARRSVDVFLSMARTVATGRGAKSNGQYDSADIVDHQDVITKQNIPASEIRASIVRQLIGQAEAQVIVAYSSLNAFEGEPVSIEIGVFKNPIIYKAGANLAETRIDGSKDEPAIFRQVVSFLSERLATRVAKDQVIPRSGSERPFGEVSTEEMLELVSTIRKADRQVFLRAQADEETRASDVVRLRFKVF